MRTVIRYSAVSFILIGGYPLFYWLCGWQETAWLRPYCLGLVPLTAVLAGLYCRITRRLEQRTLLAAGIAAFAVSVLAGIGADLAAQQVFTPVGAGAAGVFTALQFHFAWRLMHMRTEGLAALNAFIGVCTMFFLGWVLCSLQGIAVGGWYFPVLAAAAGVYCLVRNRLMLARAVHGGAEPPRTYVRHNTLLTALFLVPGAVLVLCGSRIAAALSMALGWLWKGLLLLLHMLAAIHGNVSDGAAAEPTEPPSEPAETAAQAAGDYAWLFYIPAALLVLFLVIRFRRDIAWFFYRLWCRITDALRRMLHAKASARPPEQCEDYTDSVELIAGETAGRPPRAAAAWKRRYRRYQRMKDPTGKFREGYALWLSALRHWEIPPAPYDTPEQICKKAEGAPDPDLTAEVTHAYYLVRYAERTPTAEQLAALQALLVRTKKGW